MWEWDGRVRWLAMGLVAALLFGLGLQYGRWQERKAGEWTPRVMAAEERPLSKNDNATSEESTIQVHVAGAVERPGVYELKPGARINEAVALAGLLPDADPNALNLAAPLMDGQQVVVPRRGEVAAAGHTGLTGASAGGGATGGVKSGGKININTASLAELDGLPGIGPTLAQRIIDYRNQKGPFRTIEDLQNVSGIGSNRFNEIKDLITVY
ncbi:MAG: helix-hairpin-helix domain-containing protein [Moorella sp. (in: firmicutes)]